MEQGIGFILRGENFLRVQPADDGHDPLTRLFAGQTPAAAHVADDRGILKDALGQLGLGETVLAMQMLV